MADNGRRAGWKAKDWRSASGGGAAGAPTTRRKSRGAKRFVLIAAVLALVGVIVGLLVWVRDPPRPLYLGVAVTGYHEPSLPANPWGQQDVQGLRGVFGPDSLDAVQGQEKAFFLRELDGLVGRTARGADENRPVVVHLCAQGVTSRGEVFLLPGFADIDAPATWLPLKEILDRLRGCKGPCLLLLDVARPVADARLGLLSNNVSTALDAELTRLEKAGDLKMLVLTSCEAGQLSQVSLELRQSAFAFFAEVGLRGVADGWLDGTTDDRVSAKELAEYTRSQVANWSDFHHLPAQTPKLYGTGGDFTLISTRRDKPPPQLPEQGPPYDEYPKWLAAGWAERDQWLTKGFDRGAPRTFRQLEATLLQAEQRWLAGIDPKTVEDQLTVERAKLKQPEPFDRRPVYSLAIAQRRGIIRDQDEPGDAAAEVRLARLLDWMHDAKPPADADFDKALAQFAKTPPAPLPKEAIALATLRGLERTPDPTPEELQAYDTFSSKFLPQPRFAEFFTPRLLLKLDKVQLGLLNQQKLEAVKQRIIRSADSAEQAAAVDPRTLPWVQADLDAANVLRRQALHDIVLREKPAREKGYYDLATAQAKYTAVIESAAALEQGFQSLERALVILPGLAKPLGDRGGDPTETRLWNEIHGTMLELQPLLTPPAKPALPANAQTIATLASTLRTKFDALAALSRGPALDQQIQQAPSAIALRRLLESPAYSAKDREKIFQAARDRGKDREKAALEKAAQLPPRSPVPNNKTTPADDPAWRAKLAVDVLRLVTDAKALEAKLKQAADNPSADAWEGLGVDIRRAWVADLAKAFTSADAPKAIRIGYVLHPFDVGAVEVPGDRFKREPTGPWLRDQDMRCRTWLSEKRYRADSQAFREDPSRTELIEYANSLADVAVRLLR
ncbi:MAG: hypothetical protein ACJ8F7_04170 [Gemmataceae bacterium]